MATAVKVLTQALATTLFAALNTLEGTVFGRCAPRHRHEEFIAILNQIEEAIPAGNVRRQSR